MSMYDKTRKARKNRSERAYNRMVKAMDSKDRDEIKRTTAKYYRILDRNHAMRQAERKAN